MNIILVFIDNFKQPSYFTPTQDGVEGRRDKMSLPPHSLSVVPL